MNTSIARTTVLDGFTLGFTSADGEPLFRDLDLAERAGLKDPHDIRRSVAKLVRDGEIAIPGSDRNGETCVAYEVQEVASLGNGTKREVIAYYLDEEAALEVLMRLRTPGAKALRRDVRRVYLAYMRGELATQQRDTESRLLAGLRDRGASIRNMPAARDEVQRAIFGAARQSGRTWQWVDHQIRKSFDLRGYLDLKSPDVAQALVEIAQIASVAKSSAAIERRRLREQEEADRRRGQLRLVFPKAG